MASNAAGSQRLLGRVAIVTGAASGIGRAIALAYAEQGARVVCADMHKSSRLVKEANISTADLVRERGGTALFQEVDVCSETSVGFLIARTVQEFERLDIMVNCAGIAPEIHNPQPIWSMPNETWTATMGVNATGVLNGCRAATAQMMKQPALPSGDRGWVINLSSIYGQTAAPGNVAYCASKHAVIGITKAAALDCAPHNIYVNAVCPGFTASALTASLVDNKEHEAHIRVVQPLKGIGSAADIAKMVVVLGSDDCTWVTGTSIAVDGGFLCQ